MSTLSVNKKYREDKKAIKALEKKKTQLSSLKQPPLWKKWKTSGTMIPKPKKKKKPTRWKLVKKLDSIFSQYIRLVSADKNGICTCITCGERMHWKNIQNGHYLTRWNYKYRRSEENCYSQCYVCNVLKNWNYKEYTIKMIRKHWQLKVEQMIEDKQLIKISTPRIEEKIQEYTKIVNALLSKIDWWK